MIVIGKDKTLDNFFIDENGVITDLNGNQQKTSIQIYEWFKGAKVHQIMMYTFYGYRDNKEWVIHHKDENRLNNSLNNLVYLTRKDHIIVHKKGKKLSEETKDKISNTLKGSHLKEETKDKISKALKGKQFWLGKIHTPESRQKMSLSHAGQLWFNDGVKNYRCKECPPGCVKGRLKINRIK